MAATITKQPTPNQLLSAYKPVVIECTATTFGGGIPTIVFCDVYINSVYYRTFFSSKADKNGKYIFDIQDAVQEKLNYFIPPIDGKEIEITNQTIVDVFVKIRTSKLNASGLNELEQIAPIPGTDETQPIAGEGIQSNKFFALNLLIQHEENQDIVSLLKSYQTDDWNNEALPLTRRNKINYLTDSQSSFFPFITNKKIKSICIDVRFKGQSNFTRHCKLLSNNDVVEVSNPPVVQVQWKSNNGVEDRFCNSANCTNEVIILKYDTDNDIFSQEIFVSIDNGLTWSNFSSAMVDEFVATANSNTNFWYKVTVIDAKNNSATSNVLKITKQQAEIPVSNFYYKADHVQTYLTLDTVTYLDNYGIQSTAELPRTAIAANNPCTLIVASSIVSTAGATVCVPGTTVEMVTYRATKYGNSGDNVTLDYFDKNGMPQSEYNYAPGGTMGFIIEVYACAIKGSATSNGTLEELGPC